MALLTQRNRLKPLFRIVIEGVKLDLEAKGALVREPSKPLRWHRAA